MEFVAACTYLYLYDDGRKSNHACNVHIVANLSNLFLKTLTDCASMTPCSSLFHVLTMRWLNEYFLMSNLDC